MSPQSAGLAVGRRAAASRSGKISFGSFLFWSLAPLLIAALVLTWARVETRRVQYSIAQVAQEERDWSRRARRAESEWQALSSRESLRSAARMMGLETARPHQRWKLP
jgi:hypothetical protein